MGKNKKDNPDRIGVLKFWGWNLRAGSVAAMLMIVGYLSIYCTDTLGVPIGTVGVILMISKCFDGVTDLIAGYLVDNTHTRLGKARPYEFAIIGMWFCTWLLFSCPTGWELTVKCIWIFCMYTLVNSIFLTFLYANQQPYMVRAFGTQGQIVKLSSYGGLVITLISLLVSVLFPQAMAAMATSGAGWSRLVAIFAVPLLLIGFMRFIFVKETVEVKGNSEERVRLTDIKDVLTRNKWIYFASGIGFLYNLAGGFGSANTYYFTWIGGGIGRLSLIAVLNLPLLVVMVAMPSLIQKGVKLSRILMFGAGLAGIGYCLNFFAGDNMVLLVVAALMYVGASLPLAYMYNLLLVDCAEYNTYVGLRRLDGTVSAINSFGNKIGSGIGSAIMGLALSVFGYASSADSQTAAALMGVRLCFSFFPAIFYILIVLLCKFYKLDKILDEKRAQAAAK